MSEAGALLDGEAGVQHHLLVVRVNLEPDHDRPVAARAVDAIIVHSAAVNARRSPCNPKSLCVRSRGRRSASCLGPIMLRGARPMTANIFKALLADVRSDHLRHTFDALTNSTSQLGQEIFV